MTTFLRSLHETSSTLTPAVSADKCVVAINQMSTLADLRAVRDLVWMHASAQICLACHGFQMIGVDAGANSTEVIDLESVRNISMPLLIVPAMGEESSSVNGDLTISIGTYEPLPNPARRFVSAILRNKGFEHISFAVMAAKIAVGLSPNESQAGVCTASNLGALATTTLAKAFRNAIVCLWHRDLLTGRGVAAPEGVTAPLGLCCA